MKAAVLPEWARWPRWATSPRRPERAIEVLRRRSTRSISRFARRPRGRSPRAALRALGLAARSEPYSRHALVARSCWSWGGDGGWWAGSGVPGGAAAVRGTPGLSEHARGQGPGACSTRRCAARLVSGSGEPHADAGSTREHSGGGHLSAAGRPAPGVRLVAGHAAGRDRAQGCAGPRGGRTGRPAGAAAAASTPLPVAGAGAPARVRRTGEERLSLALSQPARHRGGVLLVSRPRAPAAPHGGGGRAHLAAGAGPAARGDRGAPLRASAAGRCPRVSHPRRSGHRVRAGDRGRRAQRPAWTPAASVLGRGPRPSGLRLRHRARRRLRLRAARSPSAGQARPLTNQGPALVPWTVPRGRQVPRRLRLPTAWTLPAPGRLPDRTANRRAIRLHGS